MRTAVRFIVERAPESTTGGGIGNVQRRIPRSCLGPGLRPGRLLVDERRKTGQGRGTNRERRKCSDKDAVDPFRQRRVGGARDDGQVGDDVGAGP